MKTRIKSLSWWLFCVLCLCIGIYPLNYFIQDEYFGLLLTKTQELLSNQWWNMTFYGHIVLGGIALSVGWMQFSKAFRNRNIRLHRIIGKVYVIAVMISSVCGLYVAQFATGGLSNVIGFSLSAVLWLITTVLAFLTIKQGNILGHEKYMTYSYAICFSAVTLRIWLPILTVVFGGFETAYIIVGWLSWVPNLMIAHYLIKRKPLKKVAF